LGISLGRWTKLIGIKELIKRKAKEGCKLRILIMSTENPAMPSMLNEKDHKGNLDRTKEAIQETIEFVEDINKNQELVELRQIESACPHQTILFNDHRAVVIPYLYSNATFLSPLFDFPRENGMYDVFASEFEALWDEAK
jgi:hypothetical protein